MSRYPSVSISTSVPTSSLSSSSPDSASHLLIPPDNFAAVSKGIYRSAFPLKRNFPFLQRLPLRTVLYLCPEEYPQANIQFLLNYNIDLVHVAIAGNNAPFLTIPDAAMCRALTTILDPQRYPVLIHCNKGKHRTGCVVAVYRRLCDWSLCAVFDEYIRFSSPKERLVDQSYIECFDLTALARYDAAAAQENTMSALDIQKQLTMARQKNIDNTEQKEAEATDTTVTTTASSTTLSPKGLMSPI